MPIQFLYPTPAQMPQFQPQPGFSDQLLRVSQLWQEAEKARMEREQQRQEIEAGRNAPKMLEAMLGVPTTPPIVAPVEAGAASRAALSAAGGVLPTLGSMVGESTRPLTEVVQTKKGSLSFTPEQQNRILAVLPAIKALPVKQQAKAVYELVRDVSDTDERRRNPLGQLLNDKAYLARMDPKVLASQAGLTLDEATSLVDTAKQTEVAKLMAKAATIPATQRRLGVLQQSRTLAETAGNTAAVQTYDKLIEETGLALQEATLAEAELRSEKFGRQKELAQIQAGYAADRQMTGITAQDARAAEDRKFRLELAGAKKDADATAAQPKASKEMKQEADKHAQRNINDRAVVGVWKNRNSLTQFEQRLNEVERSRVEGRTDVSLADMTFLYSYVRNLDESTVRESERAIFANARRGLEERLSMLSDGFRRGAVWSPQDVEDFRRTLNEMKRVLNGSASEMRDNMIENAKAFGIADPDLQLSVVPWNLLGLTRPKPVKRKLPAPEPLLQPLAYDASAAVPLPDMNLPQNQIPENAPPPVSFNGTATAPLPMPASAPTPAGTETILFRDQNDVLKALGG